MGEIQSAEELAYQASEMCASRAEFSDLFDLIRARDKAIVERIRERLGLIIMPDTMIGAFYSKAIDDVLRELGGEQ